MNKEIFKTRRGRLAKPADTVNDAGGKAYSMTAKQYLAKYALVGMFQDSYYTSASLQLDRLLEVLPEVPPEFIAKTALYSRQKGFLKDVPSALLAWLAAHDLEHFHLVFDQVANNALMVKRTAHMIRTGMFGRKSFGTSVRRAFQQWLVSRSYQQLFKDSVGGELTIKDLIRLTHPKPKKKMQEELFRYLLGEKCDEENLPGLVQHFEKFKRNPRKDHIPNVPFQMLTGSALPDAVWKEIARNAPWHMTRMNLNTFVRHGVFKGRGGKTLINLVAKRLKDPKQVKWSRCFPYQLFMAYLASEDNVPVAITNALQDALELATQHVPEYGDSVVVCPDVSGSMFGPVSQNSKVTYTQIAGLFTSAIIRNNPNACVLPFSTTVHKISFNPRDSVMTNAKKLAMSCGATDCTAPLQHMLKEKIRADLVIYVSDNQSWYHKHSPVSGVWEEYKSKNSKAKLVCIDISTNHTYQVPSTHSDVMNVSGFNDNVFRLINMFTKGEIEGDALVAEIEDVEL